MSLKTLNFANSFEFKDDHKKFFIKFMQWYWECKGIEDSQFIFEFNTIVTLSDYEFIYSLWKNGVSRYDEKMQERLNILRDIYINNNNIVNENK
jgi:hypothetical protein